MKIYGTNGITKGQIRLKLANVCIALAGGGRTVCRIRHFAERHFAERIDILPTDVLPNGHFAEWTFCRTDSLPKIEISSKR
jgi:hypothetical protein